MKILQQSLQSVLRGELPLQVEVPSKRVANDRPTLPRFVYSFVKNQCHILWQGALYIDYVLRTEALP